MDAPLTFGDCLRRWRRALDLTQKQLAQRVACAVITLQKIEAGERRPSRAMAERLAEALSVPVAGRSAFVAAARRLSTGEAVPPQRTLAAPAGAADARGAELAAALATLQHSGVLLLLLEDRHHAATVAPTVAELLATLTGLPVLIVS